MGFGGISIWQLLIVLGIIVLLFGTKKLRNIGGDLGSAVKGFKKALKEDENAEKPQDPKQLSQAEKDAGFDDQAAKSKSEKVSDK